MRNLVLERALAFLDLETTGMFPENDRIVEISIAVVRPGGGRDLLTRRVNPGRPIPPEATAVHGIRDADVAGAPPFRGIAGEVTRLLEGCDLAGFNILQYDLPLLEAEVLRCGAPFSRAGRWIVDAQRIFHLKERRDLSAAVRFYTGREHRGAHGAEADVLATIEVLDAQIDRYADLPRDVEGLARFCQPEGWLDSQGKIRWAGEEAVLTIGKYRGKSLRAVREADPSYLQWMADASDFPADTRWIVREALAGRYPRRTA